MILITLDLHFIVTSNIHNDSSYHTISAPADNPEKLAEEIAKAFNGGAAGGKQAGPGGPTPGGDVPHPPHDEH